MSRVKITEYRAKKLILGDAYCGVAFLANEKIPLTQFSHMGKLCQGRDAGYAPGRFVVKVDQGVKKRFKQGLVQLDVPATAIPDVAAAWKKKGFTRFLAEPMFPHDPSEEQYLSLERVRDGIRVLHAKEGGVDIEAHPEQVGRYLIRGVSDVGSIVRRTGVPEALLRNLVEVFNAEFLAFVEINPLVVRGGDAHLLDAAVLADSAGEFFARAWDERDLVEARSRHPLEKQVQELQRTTPASLKLKVMNPNGSLFFLLSGGGGSIVIADEAAAQGFAHAIGNYGEYSGGPTREETHLYARAVLALLLASQAKRKALVIAGGVANFTDVKKTFQGVVDALSEVAPQLRKDGVKVFVRRGGPNEKEGLSLMSGFLAREKLLGAVAGSDAPLTAAVDGAIRFLRS